MVVILSDSLLVGIDSFNWLKLRSLEHTQTEISWNTYQQYCTDF